MYNIKGQVNFSDGLVATVDKSDAMHIEHDSANKKTAVISEINELIKAAKPYAEETNVVHNKFDYFKYYIAYVKFNSETFPIYFDIGKGKNDGKYHFYDITKKLETPPAELTVLGGFGSFALKTMSLQILCTQMISKVKRKFKISPEQILLPTERYLRLLPTKSLLMT